LNQFGYPEASLHPHKGLNIVHTLLKMGRHQEAASLYRGSLNNALLFNLEAYSEVLSLLNYFFPSGWDVLPSGVTRSYSSYMLACAGYALHGLLEHELAQSVINVSARINIDDQNWSDFGSNLANLIAIHLAQNRLGKMRRLEGLALQLALTTEYTERIFKARLSIFSSDTILGNWKNADTNWNLLNKMGRNWSRPSYRPGTAERVYAIYQFYKGEEAESHLAMAEKLARADKDRDGIRRIKKQRSFWNLGKKEWELAVANLTEALRMARERGLSDTESETGLALAKLHIDQLQNPIQEAQRLAKFRNPAHYYLALLWQAIGDLKQAQHHALAAYRYAWADGEPYVHRYKLNQATALLNELQVPIPDLPPYDPAKDEPSPWEAEVEAAIEKLKAEKAAEEGGKKEE
ncbi:MAG: hypothetical protein AAFN81_26255, partial [Bacteroidota bacterium]